MATAARESGATSASSAPERVQVAPPSRREFLYYIWSASVLLLLGEVGAGVVWFVYPRFAEGTFGGTFNFPVDRVPAAGSAPESEPTGRFHVSHLADDRLVVLYGVCTHLGCLPSWVDTNFRFECPCHGSKFDLDGLYIEGPAPRSLDRFRTTIIFDDGTAVEQNEDGDPIPLQGRRIAQVLIDTGERLQRNGRV
ncbi:MAG: ubiquinol-cytochrome c reductase iron-sulfur subunit [Phototrophicaceae bacterium]